MGIIPKVNDMTDTISIVSMFVERVVLHLKYH